MKKLILSAAALFLAYNLFGKGSDETTVVIDEQPQPGRQPGDVVQKPTLTTDDLKYLKPVSVRPAAQRPLSNFSPTGNDLLAHNNQTRVIP